MYTCKSIYAHPKIKMNNAHAILNFCIIVHYASIKFHIHINIYAYPCVNIYAYHAEFDLFKGICGIRLTHMEKSAAGTYNAQTEVIHNMKCMFTLSALTY